jgi:hypothetical protein
VPPKGTVTAVKPAAKEPEAKAPVFVIFPCTVDGSVELIDGIPPASVIRVPLLPVARADITFAELAYNKVLTAFVVGYVLVDHTGVAEAPDSNNWLAVAVPARIFNLEASDQTTPPALADKLLLVPPTAKVAVPIEGTPVPLVNKTPLFAVVNSETVFAADEYNIRLIVVEVG